MKKLAAIGLFALAVGYVLAHFLVALFNHMYFAEYFWLKVAVVTPLIVIVYGVLLIFSWGGLWRLIGGWWLLTYVLAMVPAGGPDLRELAFVAVLDLEVAVIWVPGAALIAYGIWRSVMAGRKRAAQHSAVTKELQLRRRLRRKERT